MASQYQIAREKIKKDPRKWLVTGVAGFIGSNLLEELLELGQTVVGLDNFSTGYQRNLDEVEATVGSEKWKNFRLIKGDIKDFEVCLAACDGIDHVLHQAALGSVPRSIENPIKTNESNIGGFLNMLVAAKDSRVKSFTYAASSSTYGDHEALPKREEIIGKPLSPYAVTKYVNELYADVFSRVYGVHSIGLRYFNVFGKRQDPNGAYAAVIPRWISQMVRGEVVSINGDGKTSRDFCFIENAVQANILAATVEGESKSQVYNVAFGERTTLNQLLEIIKRVLEGQEIKYGQEVKYLPFRKGDVRHSQADISKIIKALGYSPNFKVNAGVEKAVPWYLELLKK